jgi:predicted homoserine dehydrogenase-like protein
MIIVDTALKKREAEGRPIQVGIVGAGYMGRGMALQIEKSQSEIPCKIFPTSRLVLYE